MCNDEKLYDFHLKLRKKQECFLSPCLFSIVLEVLVTAKKKKKRYTD